MKNIAIILVAFSIVTTAGLQGFDLLAQEKSTQSAEKAERSKEKKKGSPGDKSGRSEEKAKKKHADKGGSTGLRLPRYFGTLVDETQRERILSIRAKHQSKIEDLRKQLAALEKQEMDEIEGVLTPAQRKQLESLRSEGGKADPAKDKGKPKDKK